MIYTKLQHALFACLLWFLGEQHSVIFYRNGPENYPTATHRDDERTLDIILLPCEPSMDELARIADWVREDPSACDCMLLVGHLHSVHSSKSKTGLNPQLYGILLNATAVRSVPTGTPLPDAAIQYGWHLYLSYTQGRIVFSQAIVQSTVQMQPVILPPMSKMGLKVWKRWKEDRFTIASNSIKESLAEWECKVSSCDASSAATGDHV